MDYSRMLRSMHKGMSGEFSMSGEPLTPPLTSRSSSQRKNGEEVSPSELSPGILDLHSFDTELLPEVIPLFFSFLRRHFCFSSDRS